MPILDNETIKRAIHRELNRDGQVYFVHNRIYDIESVKDRLQAIVPEARILIGHGQMGGEALEKTMLAFVRHEADILLATTIIESGLDIPNVNTIFIDEADKYGLADLHQAGEGGSAATSFRGVRLSPATESDKPVTPNAVKRLKAIEEFKELGAGFKIALRDLEIRGAGNILGACSTSVRAQRERRLRGLLLAPRKRPCGRPDPQAPEGGKFDCSIELSWRAYPPKDYVPGPKVKVELYRRFGQIQEPGAETRGLPQGAGRPFRPDPGARPRTCSPRPSCTILAERWQLSPVHVEDEYAVLSYRSARRIEALAKATTGPGPGRR